MGRISKRKKQMQESAKKAGLIKVEKHMNNNSTSSRSSNVKVKRNARIIAAASNIQTKSRLNPFSKMMKVYKDIKKLKKSIQHERLQRIREAKRRKNQQGHQERQVFHQNVEEAMDNIEDEEVMTVEHLSAFITTEPQTINDPDICLSSSVSGAPNNDDAEAVGSNFVARKNVKFIKKRTVFHRIRKLRQLAEEMVGGAAYVNAPNQRRPMALEKQAELLFAKKLKKRQVDHLAKLTGKCYTYKTLMKKLKPLLDKFPIVRTPDDKLTISLIQSLKERLKNMSSKLPTNKRIRITIVADKGEGITKICYFFNDVEKPLATENLGVLSFYVGDDDSDSIKSICEELNKEIESLIVDGLVIDNKKLEFEFFISGDCKSICSMLGVQGCNAKRFCHHCLSDDYGIHGECRTVEGIIMDANAINEEIVRVNSSKKKLSLNKIRLIKQKFNSVNHEPFFKKIDDKHIVPPALHLLMALVNKLVEHFKHSRLMRIIHDLKVEPIQGRSEYNGNSCRKILQYFRNNKPQSIDELQMFHLFKEAAKVQTYAVAKTLSNEEILECEEAIRRLFDDLDGLGKFKLNNKLHILRFHIIPFIRIHGSWGLFSEQSIERLHCLVNEYRDRISSKDDSKKNIYAIQMLILGTFFFDLR